jgi:hypothetical protein
LEKQGMDVVALKSDCPHYTTAGTCNLISEGVGLPIIVDVRACEHCDRTKESKVVKHWIYGQRRHRGLDAESPNGRKPRRHAKPKSLIGDTIKNVLSAVGITEKRVSSLIGRPCGCGRRAKKLNSLHEKVNNAVSSVVAKAKQILRRPTSPAP